MWFLFYSFFYAVLRARKTFFKMISGILTYYITQQGGKRETTKDHHTPIKNEIVRAGNPVPFSEKL